jgi:hypothetical protein
MEAISASQPAGGFMSKMRQSSLQSVAFRGTMRDFAKLAGSFASIVSGALLVGGLVAGAGLAILGLSGLTPIEGSALARLREREPLTFQRLAVSRDLEAGKVVEAGSASQADNAKLASHIPRSAADILARR